MVNQRIVAAAAGFVATAAAGESPASVLPTPPMGFNNWARFETDIHQSLFTDAADSMLAKGLLAAGYNRINLDDAWSTLDRAANKSMVWDDKKFPKGLYWLTDYIKSKGFIPGIYTDAGRTSCGGYPSSLGGFEQIDYDDFKKWGFEYLKMDGCNLDEYSEEFYYNTYTTWYDILSKDSTQMVFSDSAPAYFSGLDNLTDWYHIMIWASQYGQLARHSYDVQTYPGGNAWNSIKTNYGQHVRLARFQRPGYFNDPDFLIVDHPSLSLDEKKSHFALWSTFSAPLIISADIPSLSDEEIKYLTNKDFIAVNQDPLVQQATLVSQDGTWDVLTKSLVNGDRVVTILNSGSTAADRTVSWASLGLSAKDLKHKKTLSAKNLWTGETSNFAVADGGISAKSIPSHGTASFRISVDGVKVTPTGQIFNTFTLACLTDDKSGVTFWGVCQGADSQIWSLREDGHINSLLRPDECLADVKGKLLTRHSACHTDSWTYQLGGNLVNDVSKRCLNEEANGDATVTDCGYLTNEQVFGLPIGGKVVRPYE